MNYKKNMEPRVIFLGPPGSGKSTQAQKIKERYPVCYLVSTELLKATARTGTKFGNEIDKLMKEGKLVPIEMMLTILKDAIQTPECTKGFIIDGYPRTQEQAQKLDSMLEANGIKLTSAIEFTAPDNILLDRLTGKLVHPTSGRIYHLNLNPPKTTMKDDVTGEPLMRDTESKLPFVRRLEDYRSFSPPLIEYYKNKGIYNKINGTESPEKVFDQIKASLFR